jgi:UDP-N-acetylglucosamine kinase
LVVEKIHDLALKQMQSFIFDGTLSKFEKAVDNINRSIKLGRPVIIFYLYQKPEIAWKFTELREKVEGRNIPKEKFEEQFHNALKTVCRIREEFDDKVNIYLVKKDFEKNTVEYIVGITRAGKRIDEYLSEGYIQGRMELK